MEEDLVRYMISSGYVAQSVEAMPVRLNSTPSARWQLLFAGRVASLPSASEFCRVLLDCFLPSTVNRSVEEVRRWRIHELRLIDRADRQGDRERLSHCDIHVRCPRLVDRRQTSTASGGIA
jgi:hypothetical protein